MTIKLTWDDFFIEQFREAAEKRLQSDASDTRDITYLFDARFSQGWRRKIQLRQGLNLFVDRHRPTDHLIINGSEGELPYVSCVFTISGKGQGIIPSALSEALFPYLPSKYFLESNGQCHKSIGDFSDSGFFSIVNIFIHPSVLRSFTTSSDGELPENLRHL
ncbi:MAG: hypothetical protein AAFQ61_08870, partial [Cyanobacteria bacterium J06626_23]